MYNNYTNYQNKNYNRSSWKSKYEGAAKKKVKRFTDLDVYKKAQECAVFCAKELIDAIPEAPLSEHRAEIRDASIRHIVTLGMRTPRLIAEAHSKRFGTSKECLDILDTVMLNCNLLIAHMEQARDILDLGIENARWEEQIENYAGIRQKVLNLQRTWRKYIIENQQPQP